MIPDGWEEKQIGELARVVNGRAFKPIDWEREGAPIVRIQNLNGSHDFNYTTKAIEDKFWIENGSLLFAWSGSRGTSFGPYIWEGGKAVLNQHIFQLHLNDMGNRDFLYFALLELTRHIESTAHGSAGLVHVKKGDFESFKILMPGPQERVAIVSILQSLSASFRFAEKALAQTRRLRQALLHQLLTKGIDENGKPHTRFKKTEIGEIPEEWELVTVGRLLVKVDTGVSVGGQNRQPQTGEFAVLKVSAVSSGKLDLSACKVVTNEDVERLKCSLKKGTILFSRANTKELVGASVLVNADHSRFFLPDKIWELSPRPNVDSHWLLLTLQKLWQEGVLGEAASGTSSSMKNISKPRLLEIKVALPSLKEQNRIAKYIATLEFGEESNSQSLSHRSFVTKAVSSDLLSGRVRVKDLKL